MRKFFYSTLLVLSALGLTMSSCSKNNDYNSTYWVDSQLDIDNAFITDVNGNFASISLPITTYDLANFNPDYSYLLQVVVKDTWIEVYRQFTPGDVFQLNITVNGVGTFPTPEYTITGPSNSIIIDEQNAPGLNDFMSQSFNRMQNTTRFVITTNGL